SRRRWPLLAVRVVAVAGGAYWWQVAGTAGPQTTYRTLPVQTGSMTVEVSATGTLQPLTQVEVSSELSGVVRSVAVQENQRVASGDVLAELDTTRILAQDRKSTRPNSSHVKRS